MDNTLKIFLNAYKKVLGKKCTYLIHDVILDTNINVIKKYQIDVYEVENGKNNLLVSSIYSRHKDTYDRSEQIQNIIEELLNKLKDETI